MKWFAAEVWGERLRARLWIAPALAIAAALGASKALVAIDTHLPTEGAWFLFGGAPDGAREVLSTIASSMMTFTGLVFSITILVLQLASSQFSPRVLRTFLEDRVTHVAMAAFVGTFVYALALLAEVRTGEEGAQTFVPRLAVSLAIVLVLVSVCVFVRYIDHMAHAVRAISIIKRVSTETRRAIHTMYPEHGEDVEGPSSAPDRRPDRVLMHDGSAGVLSAVDEGALMEIARGAGVVLGLVPMPGDFVPHGAPLIRVWGSATELDVGAVREAIAVAEERTVHQDPAFGLRQLVDIAERALSPGINDPGTAVQALDEIHDLLRDLTPRRFPSAARVDATGAVRLVLPRPAFDAFVHLALDEIRQYGKSSVQVARRMRSIIEDCASIAGPARRRCFDEQRRLLEESTQLGMDIEEDREAAQEPSQQGHGDR